MEPNLYTFSAREGHERPQENRNNGSTVPSRHISKPEHERIEDDELYDDLGNYLTVVNSYNLEQSLIGVFWDQFFGVDTYIFDSFHYLIGIWILPIWGCLSNGRLNEWSLALLSPIIFRITKLEAVLEEGSQVWLSQSLQSLFWRNYRENTFFLRRNNLEGTACVDWALVQKNIIYTGVCFLPHSIQKLDKLFHRDRSNFVKAD